MPYNKYIAFVIWIFLFSFFLANGIYAFVRPSKWLRAKWTATRGLESQKPLLPEDEIGIRWGWAPFFLGVSVFLGWNVAEMVAGLFK